MPFPYPSPRSNRLKSIARGKLFFIRVILFSITNFNDTILIDIKIIKDKGLQPLEFTKSDRSPLELTKSERSPLEFTKSDRSPLEFTKSDRSSLELTKSDRSSLELTKSDRSPLEPTKSDRSPLEFTKEAIKKREMLATILSSLKTVQTTNCTKFINHLTVETKK